MNGSAKMKKELWEVLGVIAIAAAAFAFGAVVAKQDARDQERVVAAQMQDAVKSMARAFTARQEIESELEWIAQRDPKNPAIPEIQDDLSEFDTVIARGRWNGEVRRAIPYLERAADRLMEAKSDLRSKGIL
jgi:type II secretory pathway pseudopilin PulG